MMFLSTDQSDTELLTDLIITRSSYYRVAPTVMTPTGVMPRYSMATTPVTSYQIPSNVNWMNTHPQYIMQPQQMTQVSSPVCHQGGGGG